MNILVTSNGYPTKEYPINGIFAYDQAKALKAHGHNVLMAVVDVRSLRRKRAWGYHVVKLDDIEIYVYNFPLGRILHIIIDLFTIHLFKYLYKKIIKDKKTIDIVHAHFGLSIGYPTAKFCKLYNIPFVITEHDSNVHEKKITSYELKKLLYTYSNAAKLLAVSYSLARKIKELSSIESIVIPNIVDINCFAKNKRVPHCGFNIISVSHLDKSKGIEVLIRAFIQAFKNENNVNLFICGEGKYRKHLEKTISKLGYQKRIILKGLMRRCEIAELMQVCDCFALASFSETFGVAYIEALAFGIPVIGTLCGGPEDFIIEDVGLLVPVDDINAFSSALIQMRNMYETYIPHKLTEYVVNKYSPVIVSEQLNLIYQTVLHK